MTEEKRPSERHWLEQAIAALEGQRALLGDDVVDAGIGSIREKLASLEEAKATEQKRKMATVLFADIVGHTTIIRDLDPEENLEIIDKAVLRMAEPVSEHGGRIVRFQGDGFKAVFGIPEAHENDPEQAVRAGLSIIAVSREIAAELKAEKGIEDFRVRVGVDTGLVVSGGQSEAEDTIKGTAVNMAAALENSAPPGALLISHHTYQHIRGVFDLQPLEPMLAKGFEKPVAVYRVIRAKERSFRTRRRGVEGVDTRMIGRDSELWQIQKLLDAVVGERQLQAVTLVGEAGLGKSRLLYEFEHWVDLHSTILLLYRGRARVETRQVPYGLLRDIFAFRFAIQDDDSAEVAQRKFVAGFEATMSADDLTAERSHRLGYLLGYDFDDSPYLADALNDPQQLRTQSMRFLADYFRAASLEAPLLILLEDLHWADDSSLDVLVQLVIVLRDSPVLLLETARPEFFERRPNWFRAWDFHCRLQLESLSRDDSRRLVAEVLQRVETVPVALRELLVSSAGGNPFYLEELVKMFIEEGVIKKGELHWRVAPDRLVDVHVPATLAGVLQARLDRLAEEERAVLQLASVIGRAFWDALIFRLSEQDGRGMDRGSVERSLFSLREKELIFRRDDSSIASADEYVFKHAILREVTYESVLVRRRQAYHGQVAEWLMARSGEWAGDVTGIIADHLEKAGRQQEALTYLLKAGEEAAATHANEEAAGYLSRALALVPAKDSETRFALLLARERVYDRQGARAQQLLDLEAMEALTREPATPEVGQAGRRAEVALRRAAFSEQTGDYPGSIKAAKEAIEQARAAGDLGKIAEGHVAWGWGHWQMGQYDQSRVQLEKALAASRDAGERRVECITLRRLGTAARGEADYDSASRYLSQALVIAREIGDRLEEAWVLGNMGIVANEQGDYAQAQVRDRQALDIFREIGHRQGEGSMLNSLGFIAHNQGDYGSACRYYEQSLAITREIGKPDEQAIVLYNLGFAAEAQGEYVTALDYQQEALRVARQVGDRESEGLGLNGQGDALAGLCRWEEAQVSYRQAIELRTALGRDHLVEESRAGIARAALARGDTALALSQVEGILAYLEGGGSLEGAEAPLRIYLICVEVLSAAGDPRAQPFLRSALTLLQEKAAKISEPDSRRMFLENVPWHRELLEWKQ